MDNSCLNLICYKSLYLAVYSQRQIHRFINNFNYTDSDPFGIMELFFLIPCRVPKCTKNLKQLIQLYCNYEIVKTQGVFSFRKRQNDNHNEKYKDAQI